MDTGLTEDNKRLEGLGKGSSKSIKIALKFILPNLLLIILIISLILFLAIIGELLNLEKINSYETELYDGQMKEIPEHILKYQPLIQTYLIRYNLPLEYTPYLLAQIAQESYGKGPDIFQASESKYGGQVGMITTEEESTDQAVKRWTTILKEIEDKDIEFSISLVLQTYNFGSGYLGYVKENGNQYTIANAEGFSIYQANKMGWSSYGDKNYVSNVLKFIMPGDSDLGSGNILEDDILKGYEGKMLHPTNGIGRVTSEFGYRIHPISGRQSLHTGIDIGGNNKANIYASEGGTVIQAGWNGGYGNSIMIDHGNGLVTLYGHCSSLNVSLGSKVRKGQKIGSVGSTGNSTGPHLHFEVRVNGKFKNPREFL